MVIAIFSAHNFDFSEEKQEAVIVRYKVLTFFLLQFILHNSVYILVLTCFSEFSERDYVLVKKKKALLFFCHVTHSPVSFFS